MKKIVNKYINYECEKLISRHYEYLYNLNENISRKSIRNGTKEDKEIRTPQYWQINNGFNPFYVKSEKHLNVYSYTISRKLYDTTYEPKKALIYPIEKEGGGTRNLNIYQIPDAAISRLVYKSLLTKNVNLFSNYAYAYREDRNTHDAIFKINSDWKTKDRIYIAEFDFSKFFDNISHSYLFTILHNNSFLYTELEERVLDVFLKSKSCVAEQYSDIQNDTIRKRGIPQGTSISLFLANIACYELDKELENIGLQFARYADDTLIWSQSYEKIQKAYDAISFFSKQMDVEINFKKSEGISLLSTSSNSEIKSKDSVNFLGYKISLRKMSISNKVTIKIKNKLSYIIYENLLQPLNHNIYNQSRITRFDWDYIVTVYQIRRYLYGGLNDQQLRRFRLGIIDHLNFRGIMSYYPIVNDEEQLRKLDGWLIFTLKQCLKERQRIWMEYNQSRIPGPTGNWINDIDKLRVWEDTETHRIYDLKIPSFLLINKTMRVGLKTNGIKSIVNPKSIYYPGIIKSYRIN